MYPWISRILDFWLRFDEEKCGLDMEVYGMPHEIPPTAIMGYKNLG